jgi:hypothetical protein
MSFYQVGSSPKLGRWKWKWIYKIWTMMKIWDQKLILHDSSRFCLVQNDFNHSGPTVSRILAEIRRICGTTLRPVLEARVTDFALLLRPHSENWNLS